MILFTFFFTKFLNVKLYGSFFQSLGLELTLDFGIFKKIYPFIKAVFCKVVKTINFNNVIFRIYIRNQFKFTQLTLLKSG